MGVKTGVKTVDDPTGRLPPEHLEWAAVSRTPMTATDQFFIGTRETMDVVFAMDSAPALKEGQCTNEWWTWAGVQMPG